MSDWTPSAPTIEAYSELEYLGLIMVQTMAGESHDFTVLRRSDRLVFGGACNVGFLESGYLPVFDFEDDLGELVVDLIDQLEAYYDQGPSESRVVCNECM